MTRPLLHASPRFLPFVDRGDPANPDFVQAALTINGAWHDLDLSGIVAAGAAAVLISVYGVGLDTTHLLDFRRNGNANDINISRLPVQVGNGNNSATFVVPVSADRIVEYRGVGNFWKGIFITVMGWWRGA